MIAVVWQFLVDPGQEEAFEKIYGADGEWPALSRRSRSFLGSSFLRDQVEPNRYLLIEYWSEMVVYESHQTDFTDERQSLETRAIALRVAITTLGVFSALDVPNRSGPTWSRRDGL